MHYSNYQSCSVLVFALTAVSILGGALSSASAQGSRLPFKAKPDGSVNYNDLMELTRQAPSRDRITDGELAAIKAKSQVKFGEVFKATEEAESPPRTDLYASSIILSDGVNHTLLPLRSLVFVPEKYQRRVVDEPVGKLIFWPEFSRINSGWILPLEVPLPVSRGEEPLAEPVRKQFESGFRVVVSVYRKSPISMMPLKVPEPEANPEEEGDPVAASKSPASPRG